MDQKLKGVIFDIDGTLILNGKPLANAVEVIATLRNAGLILRFITNTTGKTPAQLSTSLQSLGFDIRVDEIITSVTTCIDYIQKVYSDTAGFLVIPDVIQPLFSDIKQTLDKPAFVVMGDLDQDFDYTILNTVFNYLRQGAQLISFHRNLFYFRDEKTWLDSGAFTFALEKASGQPALVTGKPAPEIFETALTSMGLAKAQVIVVGDDVLTDIHGARNIGLKAYLVATGKFRPEHLSEYQIKPDEFMHNIQELIGVFGMDKLENIE